MLLAALAILVGFGLLIWSADLFVDGASATARHLGMPSLLVGMLIVGFGTSAPEMVVSAMAAADGNSQLALGNAIGSNLVNVGLILGVTALLIPLTVHSRIVRRELPLLLAISALLGVFLWDGQITRLEGALLVLGFFALVGWTIFTGLRGRADPLAVESAQALEQPRLSLGRAAIYLAVGLALLIVSSRILVWGAVTVAQALGVSDLIIGLTIVALGTSLPELAAAISAARKGEHDIAVGNVVGSNMFNLLAVVGIAGTISPMLQLPAEVLSRDFASMVVFTVLLMVMGYGFHRKSTAADAGVEKAGRINRVEAGVLLTLFVAYNVYLIQGL